MLFRMIRERYSFSMMRLAGWRKALFCLLITAVLLFMAVAATEILNNFKIGASSLTMFYMLAVLLISSVTPEYKYGIIAAIASALLCDYFITEPRKEFSFTLGSPVTLVTMLIVSFLSSALTEQIKAQTRLAAERGRHWQLMSEINGELLSARDTHSIISRAVQNLNEHMAPRPVAFYTGDPLAGSSNNPDNPGDPVSTVSTVSTGGTGGAVAGIIERNAGIGGVFGTEDELCFVHDIFTNSAEGDEGKINTSPGGISYFPIMRDNEVRGIIGVDSRINRLSRRDTAYLRILSGQLALALSFQNLSDMKNRTMIESEKEKVKSTLLRSVFGDLRKPIASVISAAGTLLEQSPAAYEAPGAGAASGMYEAAGARAASDAGAASGMYEASGAKATSDAGAAAGARAASGMYGASGQQDRLLREIIKNAQWILQTVENILTVTKITAESAEVKKIPEPADQVITQAVAVVQKKFPDCLIHTRFPASRLEVPMDAALITRVLQNLLENAARNSPERGMILVDLRKQASYARFEISDEGGGIPADIVDHLFESDVPGREAFVDTAKGIGLGLSVCRTIIRAHGGKIEAYNKDEGGARLVFWLPI